MQTEQSLSQLTTNATLGQILSAYKPAAELLRSIGLDPANHQDQTLRSVCQQRQWSEDEVLQWLKKQVPSQNGTSKENEQLKEPDFGDNLTEWCDYVEEMCHRPLFELLPDIEENFHRVKKVHGNQYPWLKNMQWHFEKFDEALRLYLTFESQKVFPLARKINEKKQKVLAGTVRKLKRSIQIITKDQRRLRERMNTIREKGNNFRNPKGACSIFRILNHHFEQLDSQLDKQFELERKHILPLVRQWLNTV